MLLLSYGSNYVSSYGILQAAPLKTYTLGVYAYLPKAQMIQRCQPLLNYINMQLNASQIKLKVLELAEIETQLSNNKLDFVFTNPRHYVFLRHQTPFTGAIATLIKYTPSGKFTNKLGGVIFTRNTETSINQLADIKGQRIAIPNSKHLGGYLTQAYELFLAGINLPDDAPLIIMGRHEKVVEAVMSGKAEVGFVRTEILENMSQSGKIKLNQIKIINHQKLAHFPFISSTRLYPEWPFLALPHVDIKVVSQVASVLLALTNEKVAIHPLGITGFTPPADYSSIEEISRALRLPPHEKGPEFTLEDIWQKHTVGLIVLMIFFIISSLLSILLVQRNRTIISQQQLVNKYAQRIELIIDATQVGTWEWNVQTGETIFNERWAELIGYTLAELSPSSIQTWKDFTHADDLKATQLALQHHFDVRTGIYQADFRMKHKAGHWVWINDRGRVIKWDEENRPLTMIGTHTDMTERVEKEEQLTELSQRLTKIASQVPGVIYQFKSSVDGHYSFPYASDKIEDIYQVTAEQVKEDASLVFDVLHPDDYDKIVDAIQESAQTLTHWKLDYRVKYQSGEVRWLYGDAIPEREADGSILWNGFITDITEQKQSEIALQQVQNKYQVLLDDIGDQFVIFSHNGEEGLLSYVSDSIEKIFGISKEDAVGHCWAEIINWLSDSIVIGDSILRQQIEGSIHYSQFEMSFIHPDKKLRSLNVSTHPIKDKSGNLIGIDGIVEDITQRKKAQEQIRLAASVFAHSQEGILIADKNNQIVDVNPACLKLTGYTREDVIGKTPSLFASGTQSKEFYAQMWKILLDTGHWQGEIWNRKKSGEIYSEHLSIDVVSDDKGNIQHFVAVFYDITYLKEHQAELEHIAYNDALTDLPNRLLLRDRMQQALSKAKRGKKILAVCYLDLDGFKPVNDSYGHKVGDGILVEVAKRLLNTVRADDTVARIGGDEFVLLMQDIEVIGELKQALERILVAISSDYCVTQGEKILKINSISASIGVTLYPYDNNEADLLLRHADQAMYQAKQRGKNRYSFFDPKEEQHVAVEHKIQQEVQLALERNELRLFYQPKVNMHTGEVFGLEALIRWQHPQKGLLTPYLFLPSIENTPLIIEVGNWVLHQALIQMRLWQAEGMDLNVSVNIDAMQLQQEDFVSSLKELLEEFNDISTSKLELEILETSALQDIEHVSQVIKQCTQLGVTFSLDDFGTGYSSLTYLKRLPAQTLKIDKSFVRNLLESSDDMAIIEGVLGLAHAFHRTPIAEGVETVQIGTLLLNLGCKLAQGYAIARPMPAREIPQWLNNFQIPLPWIEAQNSLNSDSNYMVTLMYLNHHRIVSRVRHAIEQQAVSLIPEHFEDHQSCEIGQWLNGEGKKCYGERKEFSIIVDKHKQLHDYIKKAIILLNNNNKETEHLKTVSEELNTASNEILNCLNQLRNKDTISL